MIGLPARDGLSSRWRVERLSHGVTHGLDKWQAPRSLLGSAEQNPAYRGTVSFLFITKTERNGEGYSKRL